MGGYTPCRINGGDLMGSIRFIVDVKEAWANTRLLKQDGGSVPLPERQR